MSATDFRIVISRTSVSGRMRRPGATDWIDFERHEIATKHLRTIYVLEEWLQRWQLMTSLDDNDSPPRPGQTLFVPETIDLLGAYLWQMVLENPIGDAIVEQFGERDHHPESMRVRISFEEAPELALLPWEFLQFPAAGDGRKKYWLAAETKLVLGRFVEGPGDLPIKLADSWLRVVLVRHLPAGPEFDPQRQACEALASRLLTEEETKDVVAVKLVEYVNAQHLRVAMRAFRAEGHPVDVVHIMALFRMERGACQVMLPTGTGRDEWTSADTLVDNICDGEGQPSLVVLHLVDQIHGDFMQHSEQLAPSFIDSGVPAVLAMQYPMTPEDAEKFLTLFYGALASGSPIGEAVQFTRKELKLGRNVTGRHFGSPVLYMQSAADGHLIKRRDDRPGEREPRPERTPVSAARPAPDRARRDVENRLLRVLDAVDADTKTLVDMRSEIRRQEWPADEGGARQLVLRLRRAKQDDATRAQIYERLLAELTSPRKARP